MADNNESWATVPSKAAEKKKKQKAAANANANANANASAAAGPTPIASVSGQNVSAASRMLNTFQFLDDEEDIEVLRAKRKKALAATSAREAAEAAEEHAAAARSASHGPKAGKRAGGGAKKAQQQQQPQAPAPKLQPLKAVAASVSPDSVATLLAEVQTRYGSSSSSGGGGGGGGGGASGGASGGTKEGAEELQLRSLADFLLREFSRASGMDRFAGALASAAAAGSLLPAGAAPAKKAGGGKGGAAPSSPSPPSSAADTPYADLPVPLAASLGSFAASCGARALGDIVDDLLSAALAGVPARGQKPGQPPPPPPQAGLLVLLSAALRARPAALLAALPSLQRRALRATSAPGAGGAGGAPAVPPLLSPGGLPLTLWALAQAARGGEPAAALAAWCRLVLPALLGRGEGLPTAGGGAAVSADSASLAVMDARGREAALLFGEALLTAVDGGSPLPAGGGGRGGFFFGGGGGGGGASGPLDVRLGDDLGEAAVVPGSAVELVSLLACEGGLAPPLPAPSSSPSSFSVPSRLAALHPRLRAVAARSGKAEHFREWLQIALAQSGGAAAASEGGGGSPLLARRAAAAACLCLAGDAGCFGAWEALHRGQVEASAAVLSALDDAALAPVLATPALKAVSAAAAAKQQQQQPLVGGGLPAARELFAARLPARHRPLLEPAGGGAKGATAEQRLAAAEAEQACERLACGRALGAGALYRASGGAAASALALALAAEGAAAADTATGAGGGKRQQQGRRRSSKNKRGGGTRPRRRGSFAGAALRWALLLAGLVLLCARHRRGEAVAALSAALPPGLAARADALVLKPLHDAALRAEAAAAPFVARALEVPLVARALEALAPLAEKAGPHLKNAAAAAGPAMMRLKAEIASSRARVEAATGETAAKVGAAVRAGAGALAREARGIVERGRAAAMRDRAAAAAAAV